jgi:hypothetical protein
MEQSNQEHLILLNKQDCIDILALIENANIAFKDAKRAVEIQSKLEYIINKDE